MSQQTIIWIRSMINWIYGRWIMTMWRWGSWPKACLGRSRNGLEPFLWAVFWTMKLLRDSSLPSGKKNRTPFSYWPIITVWREYPMRRYMIFQPGSPVSMSPSLMNLSLLQGQPSYSMLRPLKWIWFSFEESGNVLALQKWWMMPLRWRWIYKLQGR